MMQTAFDMTTNKVVTVSRAFDSDDRRWAAVRAHDATADGQFYFAVKTTGVYCQPSCRSRAALRKNVEFFKSAADARRAGYRPCKRCRPDKTGTESPQAAAIRRACRLIDEAETPPKLVDLAKAAGFSPYHFHRLFKKILGVTPKAYIAARRTGKLQDRLAEGAAVTHAIYDSGFNSSSRFYEQSAGSLGMKASAYRRGGEGVEIAYAVVRCYLGHVLVAGTARGLSMIAFGDDPTELVAELKQRFPRAVWRENAKDFAAQVKRVVAFIEAPAAGLDLPLDIQGTAFQRRVWQALRQVPAGTTASYAEIARKIGKPAAVRAVAQACGANPVAVAVPCHRIVRSDGGVGGYRWGTARKEKILAREAGAKRGR
jgi:AraC family transcriptional regulator, regulatory protein of adaptative response / methylated-DNA-[protein]-cysteine methyltransferase